MYRSTVFLNSVCFQDLSMLTHRDLIHSFLTSIKYHNLFINFSIERHLAVFISKIILPFLLALNGVSIIKLERRFCRSVNFSVNLSLCSSPSEASSAVNLFRVLEPDSLAALASDGSTAFFASQGRLQPHFC